MKSSTVLFCCLCISAALFAQRNDVLFTNAQPIKESRYKDIEKSPYLFKEWVVGSIMPKDAKEAIEQVNLNYNGYTKSFEARKGNRFIELDGVWYSQITIPNKSIHFKTGMHPSFPNRFMRVIYEGTSIQLVEDFVVSLQTRERTVYGKVNMVSEFIKRPIYYLLKDGKALPIKLKKKAILKVLNNDKWVANYIKKQKLAMNKEEDVAKLLQFYEEKYGGKGELAIE